MIGWYRKGQFPFDKLIKFSKVGLPPPTVWTLIVLIKVNEFELAMEKMHKGDDIKPVLIW